VLRLTSIHPNELSPAKTLIRNVDADFCGRSEIVVAIVQRYLTKAPILPKNLAARAVRSERNGALRRHEEKIVLLHIGGYPPAAIANRQCRKFD